MTIQVKFSVIEAPRNQSYVTHSLCDVLAIVMCGFGGLYQLWDVVTYAENKAKFFHRHFGINQIPSKPTFSRILSMVDGEKVGEVILSIMRDQFNLVGDILSVDGKAIRSTSEMNQPHSDLQILTVYLTESGITIGQQGTLRNA